MNKLFYKKIIDKNDKIIGYYNNSNIYDTNFKLKWTIHKKKIYDNNQLIGYLKNNKLYYSDNIYIATIENNYIFILIIFMFIILLFTIFRFAFSISEMNKPEYQIIEVTTTDGIWGSIKEIDLLYNIYAGKDKDGINLIAPGSKASTKFILYNKNEQDVVYKIDFKDNNINNKFPIKYRLKIDNKYVAGDSNTWLELDQLNQHDLIIDGQGKIHYEIEWIWDGEDYSDTQLGINGKDIYNINISIMEMDNIED